MSLHSIVFIFLPIDADISLEYQRSVYVEFFASRALYIFISFILFTGGGNKAESFVTV